MTTLSITVDLDQVRRFASPEVAAFLLSVARHRDSGGHVVWDGTANLGTINTTAPDDTDWLERDTIDLSNEAEHDPRPDMVYDQPYTQVSAGKCTYCHDGRERTDLAVTKHHWANRPLGQLNSRCPEHQRHHDADRAA